MTIVSFDRRHRSAGTAHNRARLMAVSPRSGFISSVGPDPLDETDDIHLRVVGPHALDAEHELDADAW